MSKKTGKAAVSKTADKKVVRKQSTAKKLIQKSKTQSAVKKRVTKKKVLKRQPLEQKITKRKAAKKKNAKKISKRDPQKGTISPYKIKGNEPYMGRRQTRHFKDILSAWKQQLMDEVNRTVHHMQDDTANFPDPNDRATQEEEFTLELRTRERERKLIAKIDESIHMLEAGNYGFCETCGVEIGIRRLEARPTARLCIDCKTLNEIKERYVE